MIGLLTSVPFTVQVCLIHWVIWFFYWSIWLSMGLMISWGGVSKCRKLYDKSQTFYYVRIPHWKLIIKHIFEAKIVKIAFRYKVYNNMSQIISQISKILSFSIFSTKSNHKTYIGYQNDENRNSVPNLRLFVATYIGNLKNFIIFDFTIENFHNTYIF